MRCLYMTACSSKQLPCQGTRAVYPAPAHVSIERRCCSFRIHRYLPLVGEKMNAKSLSRNTFIQEWDKHSTWLTYVSIKTITIKDLSTPLNSLINIWYPVCLANRNGEGSYVLELFLHKKQFSHSSSASVQHPQVQRISTGFGFGLCIGTMSLNLTASLWQDWRKSPWSQALFALSSQADEKHIWKLHCMVVTLISRTRES